MACCDWSNYGSYVSRKFTDIYPSATEFVSDRNSLGIPIPADVTDTDIQTIYYLLYARYGNSHIASSDETQFKYKLFSIIFARAPSWKRRLELQTKLRTMTDAELIVGAKQISNHSFNPSTEPATDSEIILETVNEQHTTSYKKSILDGYSWLNDMLRTDITTDFVNQFKVLFLSVVAPQGNLWYVTDIEEEE